jgi:hypothetical protein
MTILDNDKHILEGKRENEYCSSNEPTTLIKKRN